MATADEYREHLERVGVWLDKVLVSGVCLTLWEVSGRCAGRRLWAQGHTRDDAWGNAWRQAEALGLLPAE